MLAASGVPQLTVQCVYACVNNSQLLVAHMHDVERVIVCMGGKKSCIHAWYLYTSAFSGLVPVSYTHLTLPTIYSV